MTSHVLAEFARDLIGHDGAPKRADLPTKGRYGDRFGYLQENLRFPAFWGHLEA